MGDDNLRAGTFADNIPFIYGSSGTSVNVECVFIVSHSKNNIDINIMLCLQGNPKVVVMVFAPPFRFMVLTHVMLLQTV